MATREAFLAKVRAAQPDARERPEVPSFASTGGDLRARFTAGLAGMGGTCVEAASGSDVLSLIHERFGAEASVCSATAEVPGTRVAALVSRTTANAEKLKSELGLPCDIATDLSTVLVRPDVHIVVICTPSGAHMEPAVAAADWPDVVAEMLLDFLA